MAFYVYENWRRKKAVVHKSDCPWCNFGKGIQQIDNGLNSRWLGEFPTLDKAISEAKMTNQPIKFCKKCTPLD